MKILKLISAIALTLSIGAIAGLFTADAIPGWYASLNRPSFNPPNWLFGPVWTMLYILMGISLFLIWQQKPDKQRNQAIGFFLFHLFLNFCWSFIFFYFKMMGLALFEIILLWMSIVVMMVMFYRIKPLAAYLNIPYLIWVSFATVLNAAYFALN
jgi:benzodiazapine receptor